MPRFFISCEGAQAFEDQEGTELPDLTAAKQQAIMQSGEIMRDHAAAFAEVGWWRVTVSDGERRPVMVLDLNLTYPGSAAPG